MYRWGCPNYGPYKEVVFINRWSLEEALMYMAPERTTVTVEIDIKIQWSRLKGTLERTPLYKGQHVARMHVMLSLTK